MRILYISGACYPETFEHFEKYQKGQTKFTQQQFDFSLLEGLQKNTAIDAISFAPIALFPYSNCLFYKGSYKKVYENSTIRVLPLVNLLFIKQIMSIILITFYTYIWAIRYRRESKSILLNCIDLPSTLPALVVRKFINCKVFAMIPDVPDDIQFTYRNDWGILKPLLHIYTKIRKKLQNRYDGYILFSGAMDKVVNNKGKPSIVIEGMIDPYLFQNIVSAEKHNPKVLMYAGKLDAQYGINNLVDAFKEINPEGFELWLFGDGNAVPYIQTRINEKIKYKGLVPRTKILQYEKEAYCLLNPRPIDIDYAKYSFPSKILEYMLSGTAVISTRLTSFPKEYEKYIYWFADDTKEGIKETLLEICNTDYYKVIEKGKQALAFVQREKANDKQAAKICRFIFANLN